MRNPFEEQAEFNKKESEKWSSTSRIFGAILFIILIIFAIF
jgi:hypothetical protein